MLQEGTICAEQRKLFQPTPVPFEDKLYADVNSLNIAATSVHIFRLRRRRKKHAAAAEAGGEGEEEAGG